MLVLFQRSAPFFGVLFLLFSFINHTLYAYNFIGEKSHETK